MRTPWGEVRCGDSRCRSLPDTPVSFGPAMAVPKNNRCAACGVPSRHIEAFHPDTDDPAAVYCPTLIASAMATPQNDLRSVCCVTLCDIETLFSQADDLTIFEFPLLIFAAMTWPNNYRCAVSGIGLSDIQACSTDADDFGSRRVAAEEDLNCGHEEDSDSHISIEFLSFHSPFPSAGDSGPCYKRSTERQSRCGGFSASVFTLVCSKFPELGVKRPRLFSGGDVSIDPLRRYESKVILAQKIRGSVAREQKSCRFRCPPSIAMPRQEMNMTQDNPA